MLHPAQAASPQTLRSKVCVQPTYSLQSSRSEGSEVIDKNLTWSQAIGMLHVTEAVQSFTESYGSSEAKSSLEELLMLL